MPNHVSHVIKLQSPIGDEQAESAAFKQMATLMKTDEWPFDFNVLIPYPEQFDVLDKARHEAEKTGVEWRKLPKNGYNQGGYEWCCANWGTKWNAYDTVVDYEEVYCCTAWSTPKPIWIELSKHFPDMELVVKYADEDRGRNCGILIYRNGELLSERTDRNQGLPDTELFADAVVYEQRYRHYWTEWVKERDQIDALKKRIAELESQRTDESAGITTKPD